MSTDAVAGKRTQEKEVWCNCTITLDELISLLGVEFEKGIGVFMLHNLLILFRNFFNCLTYTPLVHLQEGVKYISLL